MAAKRENPYPLLLLARRAVLGCIVLIGAFLILATEVHSALTGTPHALLVLAMGVSLLIGAVAVAAILSLTDCGRASRMTVGEVTE
jgi:hypothetical protein